MNKGAAKCDVHFDLQGFVSQWELERMLYPMGFPQGVLSLSRPAAAGPFRGPIIA